MANTFFQKKSIPKYVRRSSSTEYYNDLGFLFNDSDDDVMDDSDIDPDYSPEDDTSKKTFASLRNVKLPVDNSNWETAKIDKEAVSTNPVNSVRIKTSEQVIREPGTEDSSNEDKSKKTAKLVKNIKKIKITSGEAYVSRLVTTVILKTYETGYLEGKRRETHSNHVNKTGIQQIDAVVAHINFFPRIEYHYCRSQTKKKYLGGSLNLTMMYRLYKDKCKSESQKYVKKPIYEHVFNNRFNIGFHKPKKDQCSVWESYKNRSAKDASSLMQQHKDHLKDVQLSRAEKERDKVVNTKILLLAALIYRLS
ncbi:hypothetical protein ILUMI_19045 [Ignelater luminosus]|uniref:Uncharacterized protein n=1 Tax=Ignelater luminosus TaxID=2038154 RepID=A0A8K0G691_IGNLU|nr:hypothetical protein ILUMI_19045 [Ignelater luminosus]